MNKSLVYQCSLQLVSQRLEQATSILKDIEASSQSETKSSAGDKFETSREMLKQEADKAARQVYQLVKRKERLQQLSPEDNFSKVELGALVVTDKGQFYISTAIGKVTVDDQVVFAISQESPMAKALFGKEEGDVAEVRNKSVHVLKIY